MIVTCPTPGPRNVNAFGMLASPKSRCELVQRKCYAEIFSLSEEEEEEEEEILSSSTGLMWRINPCIGQLAASPRAYE
jgi:hypothetical protein